MTSVRSKHFDNEMCMVKKNNWIMKFVRSMETV